MKSIASKFISPHMMIVPNAMLAAVDSRLMTAVPGFDSVGFTDAGVGKNPLR